MAGGRRDGHPAGTAYVELRLGVAPEAVEAACHLLQELGSGGVVTDDGGRGRLTAYLPRDDRLAARLAALRQGLSKLPDFFPGTGPYALQTADVDAAAWATAWKRYWHPARVGRRVVVVPSWEAYAAQPGDLVVRLDPDMAFGTGQHASTALAVRALERRVGAGAAVGDLGTGSGILAIVAARLGAGAVWALDIDPVAVRIATANVLANDVAGRVRVLAGGPEAAPGAVDVLVANLTADLHVRLAAAEAALIRPGGVLLASGVIAAEAARVRAVLAERGLRPALAGARAGWVCIAARRGALQ